MAPPAFVPYLRAERLPGPEAQTDAEVFAYAKRHGKTDYHPVGTCKMGSDAMAVVDPELKVRGIERLRVCDSSIMPRLVSSNTNAPTLMIGERAADLIKSVAREESAAPARAAGSHMTEMDWEGEGALGAADRGSQFRRLVRRCAGPEQHPIRRDRRWRSSSGYCCSDSIKESNFLPMSPAMQLSDTMPSHRELLLGGRSAFVTQCTSR
jgi:hypothetical protein